MEESRPGFIRRNYNRLMRFLTALRLLTVNLVFLVFILVIVFALSRGGLPTVPEKGALLLNIEGSLVDQKSYVDPLSQLMGRADPEQREVLVQDVIKVIELATKDKRINSLVLQLDYMQYGGISKMGEIAPALQAFRASGKKIIAISDSYSQDQYWLAAQADEVYLHPMGAVLLHGYGVYQNYFKEALDKLLVDFHIFRVGEYKSVAEPFLRNDMSPEAKEANRVWLADLWHAYTEGVTTGRQLPNDAIDNYINHFDKLLDSHQGDTAALAVASGLADGAKTREEMNQYLVDVVGATNKDGLFEAIGFERYLWLSKLDVPGKTARNNVGVIAAVGNILDGEQPPGAIGGDTLAALVREARLDDSVRAVVLRVDSGGGSAFASEIIRNEIRLLQMAGKPVVVSMGSVAASGGYWISAGADEIWATPTTLTGSIGVFGAFPTIDKSLAKLGVSTDGVGTTDLAGAWRMDRPINPIAAHAIQRSIDHLYDRFIALVSEGRELSVEEVERLAAGRVWSGDDALQLGLVDQLGGLEQAIESAAKLAGLTDYERKAIQNPLSPQEQFLKELSGEMALSWLQPIGGLLGAGMGQWLSPLQDSLEFISRMNDPQGAYLHCGHCLAP